MRQTNMQANNSKVYTAERRGRGGGDDQVSNGDLLDAVNRLYVVLAHQHQHEDGEKNGQADGTGLNTEIEGIRVMISQFGRIIDRAKSEIAAIRHPLADDDRMGSASNQLDAIVDATEGATHTILEATEQIEEASKRMVAHDPENAELMAISEEIGGQLIRIMEACGFQDLTGQRVTKVVRTLRFIEDRIAAMISIWGVDSFEDVPIDSAAEEEPEGDAALLHGPQLVGQGISQDDIDALFD